MLPHPRPWFDAWVGAAYGSDGFWSRERPADHFRTGAGTGTLLAEAVAALLATTPAVRTVVDVGAGDGALLTGLSRLRPELALLGVDRRPRPPELPASVGWRTDHWDVRAGRWRHGPDGWLAPTPGPVLLLAVEWLDDLPTPVVQATGTGWREVDVGPDGTEQPGQPVSGPAAAWAARWWPDGRRAELGLTRDQAWAGLVAAALARGGLALAVDYGHRRDARPCAGTLTAYAEGRLRPVRPDPGLNLTAHVAVDALAAAGEAQGAQTLRLQRQQAVLDELVPLGPASPDPLQDLVRRSERAALRAARVWGDLWWLLQGPPSASSGG
jgi:putative S-adenosyl-L-methionine-dependent methyltransferase